MTTDVYHCGPQHGRCISPLHCHRNLLEQAGRVFHLLVDSSDVPGNVRIVAEPPDQKYQMSQQPHK